MKWFVICCFWKSADSFTLADGANSLLNHFYDAATADLRKYRTYSTFFQQGNVTWMLHSELDLRTRTVRSCLRFIISANVLGLHAIYRLYHKYCSYTCLVDRIKIRKEHIYAIILNKERREIKIKVMSMCYLYRSC